MPNVAHIDTSKAHEITQNACITPESVHLKPSKEHLTLRHTTSLPQVAIAHQRQAFIEEAQESPQVMSSSPGEPLGKGGAPASISGTTKSLQKSTTEHAQMEFKTNVNEVLEKESTTHTTHVAVDSTSLPRKCVPMMRLSEYRVEGSFQLRSVTNADVKVVG